MHLTTEPPKDMKQKLTIMKIDNSKHLENFTFKNGQDNQTEGQQRYGGFEKYDKPTRPNKYKTLQT